MPAPVSSRAQAILDVVERVAADRARAVPQVTPPPAPLPGVRLSETATTATGISPGAAARLVALMEEAVAATRALQERLDALEARVSALGAPDALADLGRPFGGPPLVAPPPPADADGAGPVDPITLAPDGHAGPAQPGLELPPLAPPPPPAQVEPGVELGEPLPPIRPLSNASRPRPPKDAVRRHSEPGVVDGPLPSGVETQGSTARLIAIEMAVAGATRAEVETRMRDEYGIHTPAAVVDEVFGRNTAPGTRMPWGRQR